MILEIIRFQSMKSICLDKQSDSKAMQRGNFFLKELNKN